MRTPIETFSREYLLAPTVEVNVYGGDRAIMDVGAYKDIAANIGEPLIAFTGGYHYELEPSAEVLSERVAVPNRRHRPFDSRMSLLLRK